MLFDDVGCAEPTLSDRAIVELLSFRVGFVDFSLLFHVVLRVR